MAGNEVTIVINAQDRGAKQAIEQATLQSQKLVAAVGNISKVIGGQFLSGLAQNAFRKFNGFLQESIALAKEQARVELQLDAAIRSTGGAAGLSADKIKAMASEYQSLTNFGDEAVIASSNVLLTFTAIGKDTFPRAQKAILDVSTALGQDLKSSTIQIGKALQDPIAGLTALRRVGVSFTDQQRAQIRTMVEAGDVTGAQVLILKELEKEFGGSAEAAVKADGGITQMTNSIGDMQEEIGAKLIPVMVRWTELKLRLLEAFLALPGPVQAVVAVVTALGLGFLVLAPRVLAAKTALDQMGVSAKTATLKAGGIVAVVATIVAATQALRASAQGAGTDVAGLSEDLQRLTDTGRVTAELAALFGDDLDGLGGKISSASSRVGKLTAVWHDMSQGMGSFSELLPDASRDFDDLDAAMSEVVKSGADAEQIFNAVTQAAGLNAGQIEALRNLLPEYTKAAERQAEQTRDAGAAHDQATDAARDQVVALEDLEDTLKAQADPMFALIKAQQNLAEKQDAYTDAVKRFGRVSPQAEDALLALAEAGVDVASASARAGGAFDGRLTPAMRAALTAAGLTEQQIRAIEAAAERARQKLERFEGNYRANVHTTFTSSGRPPAGGARRIFADAHGGVVGGIGAQPMQAGGIAGSALGLVGEQGPELVRLPVGSTVIPAGQTQSILGGGGGGPVTLEVVAVGSGDDLMDAIVRRLSFRVRTQAAGSVDTLLGAR